MSRRWAIAGFILAGVVIVVAAVVAVGILVRRGYPPLREFALARDKAKIQVTQNNMNYVGQMLDLFNLDQGRYPEKLEDLVTAPAHVDIKRYPSDGYLKQIPRDGWDRMIIYRRGSGAGKPFELISYGADGRQGGRGANADIVR